MKSIPQSAHDLAAKIQAAVLEVFPSSTVHCRASWQFAPWVSLTFALFDKKDFPHGIIENDPFHQNINIFLDQETGEIPAKIKVESRSAGVMTVKPDPGSYMAYGRLKTGWRDFTVDTVDKAVKRIKDYFQKSKQIIADNIERTDARHKQLVAKAVGIELNERRVLQFSRFVAVLEDSGANQVDLLDREPSWYLSPILSMQRLRKKFESETPYIVTQFGSRTRDGVDYFLATLPDKFHKATDADTLRRFFVCRDKDGYFYMRQTHPESAARESYDLDPDEDLLPQLPVTRRDLSVHKFRKSSGIVESGKFSHAFLAQTANDYDIPLHAVTRIAKLHPDDFYEELERYVKRRADAPGDTFESKAPLTKADILRDSKKDDGWLKDAQKRIDAEKSGLESKLAKHLAEMPKDQLRAFVVQQVGGDKSRIDRIVCKSPEYIAAVLMSKGRHEDLAHFVGTSERPSE